MTRRDLRHPFSFPLRIDHRGRTADADLDRHVRDLVEQLLFTAPGERVNRPGFGTDLRHAVFAPSSNELAAALEHTVRGALQQWLGEHLVVLAVDIEARDSTLGVEVSYQLERQGEPRRMRFQREY